MPKRKTSTKSKSKSKAEAEVKEEAKEETIVPEAPADGEDKKEKEEEEEAPAKKVKVSEKDRPEDCDAYWKDDGGDNTEKEDEQAKDFSWPPRDKDRQVKIVTWNVAGFRAALKKGFEAYVAQEDPDVLCLQETKVAEKLAASPEFKKILPGYHRYFFECKKNTGQHGTAVFTKTEPVSVTKGLGKKELDEGGRAITVEYEKFYVLCTYVPNSSRDLVK